MSSITFKSQFWSKFSSICHCHQSRPIIVITNQSHHLETMMHTTPVGEMWQHPTIKRWIPTPLEYNQPYGADLAHQFTISWGNSYHMQEHCTYTQPLKWSLLHVYLCKPADPM